MDMRDKLEAVRSFVWHNLPAYVPGASWSEGRGTWCFKHKGSRWQILPGSPLRAVDLDRPGRAADLLEILGEIWGLDRGAVWEELVQAAPVGGGWHVVTSPRTRRWFTGSWRR